MMYGQLLPLADVAPGFFEYGFYIGIPAGVILVVVGAILYFKRRGKKSA